MRAVLAPIGSRGDVQPMLALGLALLRAGHSVLVCAAENYAELVREHGLAYARGGRDAEAMMREQGESLGNPIAVMRAGRAVIDEQFGVLHAACAGADLLVGTILLSMGPTVAEARRIPFYWAGYVPSCLPTSELPPPLGLPPWRRPWLNRAVWRLMGAASNWVARAVINRRRIELGLAPIPDVYRHLEAHPVLLAAEPLLAQPPADSRAPTYQTGSWILAQTAPLPAQVERFLADGPPPVYIGFGSMPSADPARRTRTLVDAVLASGRRAILSSGWAKLAEVPLPDSCLRVDEINHQRLFPRMAAVVHHGGAGTTTSAARAGVPQVIVPHLFDQPFWAWRMHALGVAPPPVHKRASAGRLAAAIRQATEDAGMADRARALAQRLQESDGVGAAVRILERHVPGRAQGQGDS